VPPLSAAERRFGPGFAAVLLVLGFMVAVGFVQERVREQDLPTRARELQGLIKQRRDRVGALAGTVELLDARLDRLLRSQAEASGEISALVSRVEALLGPAGVTAVEGPGVVVELADSTREPVAGEAESDLRIQDTDLQLVVNALWRSGAEAVAVNGRRVISTTAIRAAGRSILVNYRAVSSPYAVVAIGDPGTLQQGLTVLVDRYEVWQEIYGLEFSMRGADLVEAPALDGAPDLRSARPAGPGD
jgi:uncharacterized protein YlxW (UPF0749 family)